MKPPTRIIDDPTIEPALREALGTESATEVPFDVGAGLERLQAAIGADLPPPPVDGGGLAGAKLKLLIAAGGLGVVTAAVIGWQISRSEPTPLPPPVETPRTIVAPPPLPVVEPKAPPPSEPAPTASASPKPRPTPAASASASPKERLAEEVRHLAETRRVAAGNPAAGARMADEGHARFRGGMLYQEREAVAITSLARAGRQSEARARGSRFLQQFPKSPFADQVRSATGIGDEL